MSKETAIFDRDEADQARKKVGRQALVALRKLEQELEGYNPKIVTKGKSTKVTGAVPEAWFRKFKIAADAIRRDFRLDVPPMPVPAAAPAATNEQAASPLAGLRIVSEEEEAA